MIIKKKKKYVATMVFESESEAAATFAFQNATEQIAHGKGCRFTNAHIKCVDGPTTIVQELRPEDFSNWVRP
jgi:hypothetical protein